MSSERLAAWDYTESEIREGLFDNDLTVTRFIPTALRIAQEGLPDSLIPIQVCLELFQGESPTLKEYEPFTRSEYLFHRWAMGAPTSSVKRTLLGEGAIHHDLLDRWQWILQLDAPQAKNPWFRLLEQSRVLPTQTHLSRTLEWAFLVQFIVRSRQG